MVLLRKGLAPLVPPTKPYRPGRRPMRSRAQAVEFHYYMADMRFSIP